MSSVRAIPAVEHNLSNIVDPAYHVGFLEKKATSNAPNGYTPETVDCPSIRPSIRQASGLSLEEVAWLPQRRNKTKAPMQDLLSRLNIKNFDVDSYMRSTGDNATLLPNIGLAFSGGGYRALMNGAGALAAFDSRTSGSSGKGHLGGLLQASTYIAGLSGGSWLVGSIYANNFTSVEHILSLGDDDDAIWQFDETITKGPSHGILDAVSYVKSIATEVADKKAAGFNTSLTDAWGRALSYQLVSNIDGGPGYTFSSIAQDTTFKSGDSPMPVFVADGRNPGELVIDGNATVYEINPWELGTFDPTTYAFAPLEYLGSDFSDGKVSAEGRCVRGFDNVGYIMGTSSSLFNQGLVQYQGKGGKLAGLVTSLLEDVDEEGNDVASYPNPFRDTNPASSKIATSKILTLVDGGEDLQNLPLHPLTQPQRAVDVIFAIDASADTLEEHVGKNWPNGTALVATYARSLLPIANGTAFPAVPDVNTFVNLGLNGRPVFFGCDAGNASASSSSSSGSAQTTLPPLIVYIPNAPYSYMSNVSTFQMDYAGSERAGIIENGYNVATMGNGTTNSQWPTCVGCAILHRSFSKTGTTLPEVCEACFREFCWDGSLASEETIYNPGLKLGGKEGKAETSGVMAWREDWYRILVAVLAVCLVIGA